MSAMLTYMPVSAPTPAPRDRALHPEFRKTGDNSLHVIDGRRPFAYPPAMGISANIISTASGQQIQKHVFGRIPFVGTAFHLENGERVTAQRVEVGKPAPGKFATPVNVWVTPKV